jgi:hypothetical protein
VVVRLTPFHLTTEVEEKFVPVTVSVKAEPPAGAQAGLRLVMVRGGMRIENVSAFEAPPPGAGLKTVIGTFPVAVILAAGTVALNCVGEPKVVARSAPFRLTLDPETKSLPYTFKVKLGPSTVTAPGFKAVSTGTGLTMEKVIGFDWFLSGVGLMTVMLAVPRVAISEAEMVALTSVGDAYVVGLSELFHWTTEPGTKFVPVTVSVKVGPLTKADEGDRAVIVGSTMGGT